jgi:hypothetical protein
VRELGCQNPEKVTKSSKDFRETGNYFHTKSGKSEGSRGPIRVTPLFLYVMRSICILLETGTTAMKVHYCAAIEVANRDRWVYPSVARLQLVDESPTFLKTVIDVRALIPAKRTAATE